MAPACDPFERLPDAVLSTILEKADCTRSCLLVCKRWRQVCESATWLSIVVKGSTNRSPISARYRGRLKSLKLLAESEVPLWEWVEEFKDSLEDLSMEGGTFISKVAHIFECLNLKRLRICRVRWEFLFKEHFGNTPALKHLTELELVQQAFDVCPLESMIRLCPCLRRLVVDTPYYSGGTPKISSTTLEELDYDVVTLQLDAPNLKIMKLNTCNITAKIGPCLQTLILNNGLSDSKISNLRSVDRLVFERTFSFTDYRRTFQIFKGIEVRSLQLLARVESQATFTGLGEFLASSVKCTRLELTSDLFKFFKASEVLPKMPSLKKLVVHACDLSDVVELKYSQSWLAELKRGGRMDVVVKIEKKVYEAIALVKELEGQVDIQASELENYKSDRIQERRDDAYEPDDLDDYASYDDGWDYDFAIDDGWEYGGATDDDEVGEDYEEPF